MNQSDTTDHLVEPADADEEKLTAFDRWLYIFVPICFFAFMYMVTLLPGAERMEQVQCTILLLVCIPFIARGINELLFRCVVSLYVYAYAVLVLLAILAAIVPDTVSWFHWYCGLFSF